MYCQDLQDSISSEVEREVDDIAYRCTDNSMIITVTYMGRILEFNVRMKTLQEICLLIQPTSLILL